MKTPDSLRHLRIAVPLVIGVLIAGTIGYMVSEKFSFGDALYTTIGMMSTVGHVIHPLSEFGRLFTIGVIVLGVGSLLYTFGAVMEFMIEGHFSEAIRRHFMESKIAKLRNHAIVCGFGRVGSQIIEEFSLAHVPFVIIDDDENNIQTCLKLGYLVLQGDATTDTLLREAGIEKAKTVLIATDNDAHNISIALSARHLNKSLFIVARANHDETKAKLKLAGANRVLSPYTIAGRRMANLAIQPEVVEFFDTLTKAGGVEIAVEEVIVPPSSPLVGKTLTDAQGTLSSGVMIVALKKPDGFMPSSKSESCVEAGDTAIVVGAQEQLAAFQQKNRPHS
jgi:voltage-gated potassium channel